MLKRGLSSVVVGVVFLGLVSLAAGRAWGQDSSKDAPKDAPKRGRKYTPPPDTARISVQVIKATNGRAIDSAAVIFHVIEGPEKNKGNMELKTNEEGKALIDVIPIGATVRLQIIANGYQTFGDDYKIESDTKEIVVKMKRPVRQYSTYEHPQVDGAASAPKTDSTPAPGSPAPK